MDPRKIKKIVKYSYGKIAGGQSSCCSGCGCDSSGDISKSIGYSNDELACVPEADLGLGCGNPIAISRIKEGDTVLDLGSGAGIDAFLAAKKAGKSGKVIGVDMTEEMIAMARRNAEKYDYANVEFRLGDIEDLPVENDSIDVIISNCVINLAPDKSKVFREAFRVLRAGGRMYVSDIVLLGELSEEQRHDEELIAGCVGGALLKADYLKFMEDAGFKIKILGENKEVSESQYRGLPLESITVEAIK